jgi:hypothetical protein
MIKNVADSSGQGNNGVLIAAATSSQQVAGVLGQALKFNGTTNFVDAGASSSLTNTQSSAMAISFWVNINTTTNARVAVSETDGDTSSGWFIDFGVSTSGKISAAFVCSNADDIENIPFPTVRQWHLLTVTWDGTKCPSSTSHIKMYMDSVVQTTTNAAGNGTFSNTSSHFFIGCLGSTSCISQLFNGSIDDVRIYNRALSAAEVLQLYKLGH